MRQYAGNCRKDEEFVMTMAEQLIQQGRAQVLEQLILENFGTLPPFVRERLASATEEQFSRYCRRILRAETLDEMLDD